MALLLSNFIKNNLAHVNKIQNSFDHDQKMVEGIKSGNLDPQTVKRWMQGYGLFQGIKSEVRNQISNAYVDFVSSHRPDTHKDLKQEFFRLHETFYIIQNRKWISAASKLLWCLYPHNTVIYDAFVERSILVLQCVDEDLIQMPRLGKSPKSNSPDFLTKSTEYYWAYSLLVKKLHQKYQPLISQLKSDLGSTYPYDIRLTDKLLWLMGDHDSEIR